MIYGYNYITVPIDTEVLLITFIIYLQKTSQEPTNI